MRWITSFILILTLVGCQTVDCSQPQWRGPLYLHTHDSDLACIMRSI